MKPRPDRIVSKLTAEGVWKASSALHVGGDDRFDSNVDMALARDHAGNFYIPGASIAGAARSYLARSAGFRDFISGRESSVLAALFGAKIAPRTRTVEGSEDDEESDIRGRGRLAFASLLRFHEAPCAARVSPPVRDCVAINSSTGNATDGSKFNLQVLPAGLEFRVRVEMSLYEELPYGIDPDEARNCFRHILEAFRNEGLRLGAKTRRGLGCGEVANWTIREFDLSNSAHTADWLEGHGSLGGDVLQLDDLGDPMPAMPDRVTIDATLRLVGSLIVRQGSADQGPDVASFSEAGRSWIPGTSVAGAFRHRVEKIANTLDLPGAKLTQELFGYAKGADPEARERAGRVQFTEVPLERVRPMVQSRVSIDRFTGGAMEALLFEESPVWSDAGPEANLALRITVDHPTALEERLIFLAFKDLWLGDLPIGGESGAGRGLVAGVGAAFRESQRQEMRWVQKKGRTHVENGEDWRKALLEE